MTYLKKYLPFVFVFANNKKKKKKKHILHNVIISYLKLNIYIVHQTVNNNNEKSSTAKMIIHPQCPRKSLYSAITFSRQRAPISKT